MTNSKSQTARISQYSGIEATMEGAWFDGTECRAKLRHELATQLEVPSIRRSVARLRRIPVKGQLRN